MDWIFYYAEQVAEVLQREVFEDGNHLQDSPYPWSCQGRGELQLQGHPRRAKGWPCGTEAYGSCRSQATPVGSTSWAGASPFCCFFKAWARGTDAVDATRGLCGLGVAVLHGQGSGCDGSLSSLHQGLLWFALFLLHSFYRAKSHWGGEKCYIKANKVTF